MNTFSRAVAFVILLAAAITPSRAQDPKPAPATVTLTDTISGMSRLDDKKVELRLNNPPGKGSILTAPHVLVDETKTKVNPFAKKPLAFQGQLTTKDVVVGKTGSIPAGKITAKALYLIAAEVFEITDANKAKLPATGMAQVQGKLLTGNFAAGKGITALHAIANGDQPIALLLKDGTPMPKASAGPITATGRLRVADNGALVLDVEMIAAGEAQE
jgi:hypothetical protein